MAWGPGPSSGVGWELAAGEGRARRSPRPHPGLDAAEWVVCAVGAGKEGEAGGLFQLPSGGREERPRGDSSAAVSRCGRSQY